jgi:hypothetical protein
MAFRQLDVNLMLKGTLVAIVERIFPEGAPTLREYSRQTGVAASTFRRSAAWLLCLLPGLLRSRRPGPQSAEESEERRREEAVRKLQDLSSWILRNRRETEKNNCFSPPAKLRIATLAEEIQSSGVMTFAEIAEHLGMDVRQLSRIRDEVACAGSRAPEEKSRRPEKTGELMPQIQDLIAGIEASADSRHPYGPTDVKRILEKNYSGELRRYHGRETISVSTVAKYMGRKQATKAKRERPRGSYRYPEPFQQVVIDTSHFKLLGFTFYMITVFEMGGRLNLLTRVFLRERISEVLCVLEEYLERYPGVEVVVIDRGTPYLNDEVKALLEVRGRLRIVCPPRTPTAKAACERHFKTLKAVIRKATNVVFSRYPDLGLKDTALALEFGTAVFSELYHQIPQEGIDGKSPAERIEAFDPMRASALLAELFERSVEWEPEEDFARWIHERFQLPGEEEETVRRLKPFGTRVLRLVVAEVSPYMEPPYPKWMRDPLGYLAAKAHEIWEKEQRVARERRLAEEKAKRERQERERSEKDFEEETRVRREHPERFVDRTVETLVRCARSGFEAGMKLTARRLGELLNSLSEKLGCAFAHEVDRIKGRIHALAGDSGTAEVVTRVLDDLVSDLLPVAATTR